jgi:GNAT superfamily N-acetyltransferase
MTDMLGFGVNARVTAEHNEKWEPEYFGDVVQIIPPPGKVEELTRQGKLPAVKPAYTGRDLGEALLIHIAKFYSDHGMEGHKRKIMDDAIKQRHAKYIPPQEPSEG